MRLMAIIFQGADGKHTQKVIDMCKPENFINLGFSYLDENGNPAITPIGFVDKSDQQIPISFMTDPEFDPFLPKFESTELGLMSIGFVDNSDQKHNFKFSPTYVPQPTRIIFADKETGFTEIPYFADYVGKRYSTLSFEETTISVIKDLKFMSTLGESMDLRFVNHLDQISTVVFFPN